MVFFLTGENKQKLTLLYLLREAKQPLSKEQLITAAVELGNYNYFSLSMQLLSLEQDKYIASVPVFNRQMTVMTSLGEETIKIFDNMLPKSFREALNEYIDSHRSEYHRENTSRIDAAALPDGKIGMTLALVEAGEAIFEIRFKLPNAKQERTAERNWELISEEIYLKVIMKLTDENMPPRGDKYGMGGVPKAAPTVLTDGSVDIAFMLFEADETVFEIRLKLPDIGYAALAERNWALAGEELYKTVVTKLTKERDAIGKLPE